MSSSAIGQLVDISQKDTSHLGEELDERAHRVGRNKMVQLAFLEAQSPQRMETKEKNDQKFKENQAH